MLPRSTTTDSGKSQGKDTVTKQVRAGSKVGAVLTARLDAAPQIPLRSQSVAVVNNMGNTRFLDRWEIEIKDKQKLKNLGR